MSGPRSKLKARRNTNPVTTDPRSDPTKQSAETSQTTDNTGTTPKDSQMVTTDNPDAPAGKTKLRPKKVPRKKKEDQKEPSLRIFASRTKDLDSNMTLLTGNEPTNILQAEAKKSTKIQTRRSNKTVHPGTDLAPEEKRKTPPPKLSAEEIEERKATRMALEHEKAKAQARLAELEGNLNRLQANKSMVVNRLGGVKQSFTPPTLTKHPSPEIDGLSSGSEYEVDELESDSDLNKGEEMEVEQVKATSSRPRKPKKPTRADIEKLKVPLVAADDGSEEDAEPPSKRKAKSQLGSVITKKTKPQDIGGLTDDWDKFVAELFPPEYADDSDHLSSLPASEPAVSEPSSRPSSRASGLMELDGTSEQDDQGGEDNHAVRFGGFEPQEPIVKPAAVNTQAIPTSTANALTKVKDNAPTLLLQNAEPPVGKKKKTNKLNRNDLNPLIKNTFAKLFEPILIHRIASLAPSWYPRGSTPNIWLVPTASMLQTEYDAIVKQETGVAHAVCVGDAVFSCARTALYNYRGSLRVNSEKAILLFFLDNKLDNILDRARCAQQAVEVSTDEKSGEPDVDRGFLWRTFGLDETDKDGLFENFCIMYTLGSYLKTANNNALIAQEMLTSDGRPKGALLMSIIACYRAFKYHKSGVFLVDPDDGRGDFSEGNWGLTTSMGAWVQEIYQEITDLDDGDWTSLLTLAVTTYDSNYKRNPSQEQSARLAAASEAATGQGSSSSTTVPVAPAVRHSLKAKRTTSKQ